MKKAILPILLTLFCLSANAQLNMSLLDQLDYTPDLNDVWGWADPDTGIEYALVGARTGVSIVSLEDPENVVEVAWIPGESSTWRDLKTWGSTCYVVTDQGGTTEGVTVIDLSDLPNSAPYYHWTPNLSPEGPGLSTLETCHNIYIDEFGYAYLAGCNMNSGGMLILDVFSNPGTPEFVAAAPNTYSHDVYVRDNLMYSSEIYAGQMAIYDVEDKQNIQFLGSAETPFSFTHNVWLSDDGNVAFTTDEQANAPVAAYDVSDPTNIVELDQYQPLETLGDGVVPHNVHVWNDWLIISYYSDGGIIVDAAQPDNLIEVGNFDTFFGGGAGFNGAWGAYPFLPSGIVLVTDIDNGLYVLDADYKRACYLEGNVTSSFDGSNLSGVDIEIQSSQLNQATTNLQGDYKTGQVLNGTFDVVFTKPGYVTETVSVDLENGETTVVDVVMDPLGVVQGSVVRDANGDPVPNAEVFFDGDNDFFTTAGVDGTFQLIGVEPGDYAVYAGAWGYITSEELISISGSDVIELSLTEGYYDDFTFDFSWTSSSDATSGAWEWVIPQESTFNGALTTPGMDVSDDFSNRCYVTGNGGNGGSNDVDNGTVSITSPVMDLSGYNQAIVSYQAFFFNGGGGGGSGDPDDALRMAISNGTEVLDLEIIENSLTDWSAVSEFDLTGMIELTDNMQFIVETSDLAATGHIVEAAFDFFQVIEGNPTVSTQNLLVEQTTLSVSPNPSSDAFELYFELPASVEEAQIEVYNVTGQRIDQIEINGPFGESRIGLDYADGLYILRLSANGQLLKTTKLVKSH
ncbi:MAG: choice-of-anchor B family protein [Bacteroidetes bacterium]|nr:choice-of-anchor B family protein [Bacteroidota bacterium]